MRPAILLALMLASPAARADRSWYGYEVAATDAGGLGAVALGAKADILGLELVGAATLVVGPAIVHGAHGESGHAAESIGLRLGGPLIGGLIGRATGAKTCHEKCFVTGATVTGIFVGYVAAALVDIALISYENTSPAAAPRMISFGVRF